MGDRQFRALIAGAFALIAALTTASRANAQASGNPNLSSLLPELILREITLPTPTTPGLSHAAHFSPFTVADLHNPAVEIVEAFNKLMVVQLSTFPIGSSAGGFSYAFDPTLGTFKRASSSFGPLFAERAATIGRRRFSAGFNYQHSSYDRFEGSTLDNGSIKFYLRHQECCSSSGGPAVPPNFGVIEQPNGTLLNPFFEGDLIEAALTLDVSTDMFALFGNYGLTDRWDVGIAVPFVRVEMDATALATIKRLATAGTLIHTFQAGVDVPTKTFNLSGSATGIGDVEVRTKYRLLNFAAGGLAAAADVRLPTGNEADLLGGSTQVKVFVVESGGSDRLTQHVNVGYTFSSNGNQPVSATQLVAPPTFPDEINYAAGLEFVAHPRITIIGDIVGRNLRDAGRLELQNKTFQFQPPGNPPPPIGSMQFEEFEPRSGNLNLLFATAGVKFNPTGNLLFSASVLYPLTDAGLKSRLTTIIGMDYAF
jgi:hypothetical protein